jgi:sterol 14alpha-demethylase
MITVAGALPLLRGRLTVPGTTVSPSADKPRQLPPMVSGALPVVGHAPRFLRDQLQLLERGYAEHGEVFRLRLRPGRRPAIFMLGPERARWVFKHTDDLDLSIGPSLAFTRRLFGSDFYFLAEPEEYQHQRETLLPLFRGKMMLSYLTMMERRVAEFTARLGDCGTFDLPHEMNDLVLGVIMEAFLGADFARHMPDTVASDFRDFIRGVDPITPGWVPAPHLRRARRARDKLRGAVAEMVRARRSDPLDPPDFLQELMSSRQLDGAPVTDQWVVQMALGVTFAGHDSTTGHLSWALIDLLQHPDELRKILDEQQRLLPDQEAPLDLATVHRMTCLDRALQETERLRPVAPVMLRRAMRPIDVDGRRIPAGADVFVAPIISHRLPPLFEDATRYHPDRFLADPRQVAHLHGFGGGTHRCLGEHFADLLVHVAITRMLQRYELSLADPNPAPVRTPAFKGPRSPCRIRYRRRD